MEHKTSENLKSSIQTLKLVHKILKSFPKKTFHLCLENLGVKFKLYYKSNATCAFKFDNIVFQANGCGQEKTIAIKKAFAQIFEDLQKISWHIIISTDIGKIDTNSCIFLRKIVVVDERKVKKLHREGNIFTFSPSGHSNILLLDVPSNVEKELVDAIKSNINVKNYELIENREGALITSKLSMSGFAWAATGGNAISIRKMILDVIETARKYKFELVTNINLKGTTDSLMFQHKMSLQSGSEDMFAMSLNRNDRLRLICAPSYIVTACEEVLSQHWGIQGCKQKESDCYEFKLYGNPWWADGESAAKSRFLIATIISKFKSVGWEIGATVDVSRKLNDKTVFIFRQCPPETQDFAVLSFHESDKLRFMSSVEDSFQLTDFIDRLLDASGMTQNISFYWKAKQWKIKGVPFSGDKAFGVDLRLMVHQLTKILKHFHQSGWRLVASADISAKYHSNNNSNSYPLDTHSLFFLHDPESMVMSDTVVEMEETMDDQYLLPVNEIKGEKSQWRYIYNVVLPVVFVMGIVVYYVVTIAF